MSHLGNMTYDELIDLKNKIMMEQNKREKDKVKIFVDALREKGLVPASTCYIDLTYYWGENKGNSSHVSGYIKND